MELEVRLQTEGMISLACRGLPGSTQLIVLMLPTPAQLSSGAGLFHLPKCPCGRATLDMGRTY